MELPSANLPSPPPVPRVTLKVPVADVPYFPPIVVPPTDLEEPDGVKAEAKDTTEAPPPSFNLPVLDIPIPLPTGEVVTAATYAAVTAVAATTFAQPLFDTIKKKLTKFLQGKVDKWKKNRKKKKDSSVN